MSGHALVLGGSSGRGTETVRALAACGAAPITLGDARGNDLRKISVDRLAAPRQIAFLCSDSAADAVGGNVVVDGGYR